MVMTKRIADLSLRPWLAQLGPRVTPRRAMASPPANTYNAGNDTSSIANAHYFPLTNDQIDNRPASTLVSYFMAGGLSAGTGGYPNKLRTVFTSVNYASYRFANANKCAFIHIGRHVEFRLMGNLQRRMLVKIDDEYVSLNPQTTTSNGAIDRWVFDFGSDGIRRVEWMSSSGDGLIGIAVGPNDGIAPAPRRGPRMIVVSDSFGEGSGASAFGASSFPAVMGDALGWDDVWPSGVGSTGYTTRGIGPYLTYGERMATDVYPFDPDIVLFSGGINSGAAYAATKAECLRLYRECRAMLPRAKVVVADPFWVSTISSASSFYLDSRRAIREAAADAGLPLLSTMEMPLPSGFTPQVATLTAAAPAGAATLATWPVALSAECSYAFDDGVPVRIRTVNPGSLIANIDGTLGAAQANGARLTQIGGSVITGTGHAGAPSGYGTSDRIRSGDLTHPTQWGHDVHGTILAHLLLGALQGEARAA